MDELGFHILYFISSFFNIYGMMINDFDDFILESYLVESVLYFSPRLRNQLRFIATKDNKIAKEILDLEKSDTKHDITLVDLDPYDYGYLTFIPMKNALKKIKDYYPNASNADIQNNIDVSVTDYLWSVRDEEKGAGVYKTGRNSIKLGKFVNKLLYNKFNSKQIEEFINLLKSEKKSDAEEFKIVSGEEIGYWYDSSTYYENRGVLGGSCMKNAPKHYFKIYEQNPDSVRLLILTLNGRLLGRALVWKLKSISPSRIGAEYYMDRVYTIDDYQVNKFTKFAKENGWAYREYPQSTHYYDIVYKDFSYGKVNMQVKVKPGNYVNYPYMDTFSRYDDKKGILYNDDKKRLGGHILRSTSGTYDESIPRVRAIINRFSDFIRR